MDDMPTYTTPNMMTWESIDPFHSLTITSKSHHASFTAMETLISGNQNQNVVKHTPQKTQNKKNSVSGSAGTPWSITWSVENGTNQEMGESCVALVTWWPTRALPSASTTVGFQTSWYAWKCGGFHCCCVGWLRKCKEFICKYIYIKIIKVYIYKQYIRISYIYTQHDGDITCTCPIGQSIKVFLDIWWSFGSKLHCLEVLYCSKPSMSPSLPIFLRSPARQRHHPSRPDLRCIRVHRCNMTPLKSLKPVWSLIFSILFLLRTEESTSWKFSIRRSDAVLGQFKKQIACAHMSSILIYTKTPSINEL